MAGYRFDCRLFVAASGTINIVVPQEDGPRKLVRLQPVSFQALSDPVFAPLLAAFENVDRKVARSAGPAATVN